MYVSSSMHNPLLCFDCLRHQLRHSTPLFALCVSVYPLCSPLVSLLFFRLAAETLAGLNMQPRSSGDQPRSASAGLDDSSDDSPPVPTKKLSKHPAVAKQRARKMAPTHKPAVHTSSVAAAHAYGSGASVHPVLGLYVPHARRSYHRDGTALGAKGSVMASSGHCEGRAPNGKGNMVGIDGQPEGRAPFASSRPHAAAPARGRQRKGSLTAAAHAKPAAVMHHMPSDSSMTVSADCSE